MHTLAEPTDNAASRQPGIEDPVVFEENPGTSSRLHLLQRPKFRELLTYARPGDTVHISEMFRLVRGTGHILDVLDVLHREQVALRIHDGAFDGLRAAEAKGNKGGRRPSVHRGLLAHRRPLDGPRVPRSSRHGARPEASTRTESVLSQRTPRISWPYGGRCAQQWASGVSRC
ncbi:recombinase family protein [Streptomyces sp. NPDC059104]|uniref:recombinase family protein n=1 Tax=Streptomyces sp. NPDC059104 TaxID=3346729 RepID=UPI0036C8E3DF